MAVDEDLAQRIRELLDAEPGVTERRMFGGLAFMVDGHMAVAANRKGVLMVRVGPDAADELVATTGAQPVEMRGRPMRGWLQVEPSAIGSEAQLRAWIDRGLAIVRSLPAKQP